MKEPATKKRGGKAVYPWEKLQKKGDFFELPKADLGKANSCRTRAREMGLKATVLEMVKGGYLCKLLEDRKTEKK